MPSHVGLTAVATHTPICFDFEPPACSVLWHAGSAFAGELGVTLARGSARELLGATPRFPYCSCDVYDCACSPYNVTMASVTNVSLGALHTRAARLPGTLMWGLVCYILHA